MIDCWRENMQKHVPLAWILALEWQEGIDAIMPCEDRNELESAAKKGTTYIDRERRLAQHEGSMQQHVPLAWILPLETIMPC